MSAKPEPAALDELTLARVALAAARAVDGVADISRGHYAVARTYGLGGQAVEGVQLTQTSAGLHAEVHLIARLVPIPPLAGAVRAAVAVALCRLGVELAAVDVWVDGLQVLDTEEGAR